MPRTQAERTATTRAALLDATVSCLSDLGYSGTTTTEIARRAGVSRGAQVHHFPAKNALVIAAVDFLLERRLEEYRDAFERLPAGRRDAPAALDLLWPMFTGPTFAAWLELVVAARTDPFLREALEAVTARFDERVHELFLEMFPPEATGAAGPASLTVVRLVFAVMEGLALQYLACDDDGSDVIGLLKLLSTVTLPPT